MDKTTIDYLREERQRHLNNIAAINHKVEVFLAQYQKEVDREIQGVEYIENTLADNGIPVEEPEEEVVTEEPEQEEQTIEEQPNNGGITIGI